MNKPVKKPVHPKVKAGGVGSFSGAALVSLAALAGVNLSPELAALLAAVLSAGFSVGFGYMKKSA